MALRTLLAFALALALALPLMGGCAPSVDHLLAHRHHREAICAARVNPGDAKQVEDAIFAELAPKLHAALVEEGNVRAVRVRIATNALPVDRIEISLDGLESASLRAIAAQTHETLPGPTLVKPSAAGELASAVLTIISLGLLRIDSGAEHEVLPSDADLARAAPIAFAAARALRDRCEPSGIAARCTYHFLARAPSAEPATLRVRIALIAASSGQACSIARTFAIEVPTSPGSAFVELDGPL